MTTPEPASQAERNRQTREAYDRLAAVWAALERYPGDLAGLAGVPAFIVDRLRLDQQDA
jgi:hypothetical protein